MVLVASAGGDGDGGGSDPPGGQEAGKARQVAGRQGGRARIDATGK